jgi:hypothetical protein
MAGAIDETSRLGLEPLICSETGDLSDQTGWELGDGYQVILFPHATQVSHWRSPGGVVSEAAAKGSDLAAEAAALAVEVPRVESTPTPASRLSGNLAEDVHDICGLTWEQIAQVFNVSERAAAGWRMQGVPSYRQETMEALRAIGVTLVGGLGPEGVARWLTAGSPSRLRRMRGGDVEAVAEEARSYLDGPAT